MQRLRVSEMMRTCLGAIVPEDTPLRTAAEILVTADLSVLIATDSDGALAGVVPETAVVRQLLATTCRQATISDILSRHVESVLPDATLYSVLHLFRSACHSVIPVVDEARQILGLLYRQDVVRFLLSEMDEASPSVTSEPHFLNKSKARVNRPKAE